MEDTHSDGIVDDFAQALEFLNNVTTKLRPINPQAANELSRLVNDISHGFVTAIVECESFMETSVNSSERRESNDSGISVAASVKEVSRTVPLVPPGFGLTGLSLSNAPEIPPGFEHEIMRPSGSDDRGWQTGYPSPKEPTATSAVPYTAAPVRHGPSDPSTAPTRSQNLVLDLNTPSSGTAQAYPGISWARIAALEEKDKNKDFASKESKAPSAHPLLRKQPLKASPPSRALSQPEALARQSRVIWIFNCLPKTSLSDISAGIHEGPLMSIVFALDRTTAIRCCCVIFHQAEHAIAFLSGHRARRAATSSKSPHTFFSGEHVELGEPYAADAEIRAMDFPSCARRRLTVVRKGLFCDGQLVKRAFERDVHAMAGKENVELIHLYNTGNATIILASVKCAMMVKAELERRARRGGGPYAGAAITFSKDPCEAPIRLISVMENAGGKRGVR